MVYDCDDIDNVVGSDNNNCSGIRVDTVVFFTCFLLNCMVLILRVTFFLSVALAMSFL